MQLHPPQKSKSALRLRLARTPAPLTIDHLADADGWAICQSVWTKKKPTPRPASGYYGVTTDSGRAAEKDKRWKARIRKSGKEYHIGTFDTKEEAALAYDREARACVKCKNDFTNKMLNFDSIEQAEEAAAQAQAVRTLTHSPKQRKPPPASGFYGVTVAPTSNGNR
jgi:type VI protein secretion system component VasA